jgi:hypothetical protein
MLSLREGARSFVNGHSDELKQKVRIKAELLFLPGPSDHELGIVIIGEM